MVEPNQGPGTYVKLRDNLDELEVAIGRSSAATGIPIRQVRKDYWLTEILRACAAAADERGAILIFKGGTSLSKVYELIKRFSEDIDLLLVAPGTKGAVHSTMKEIVAAVESAIGLEGELEVETANKGVYRAVYFKFPNAEAGDKGVKLEIGCRGGALPNELRPIYSLAARAVSHENPDGYQESATFLVPVLSPARTLIEKLVILHEADSRAEPGRSDRVRRTVRHYYDIYQLLGSQLVLDELAAYGAGVLAREVCQHSTALGMRAVPYPSGGLASSKAFDLSRATAQRAAYVPEVRDLLWPGVTSPEFEECLARILENRDVL